MLKMLGLFVAAAIIVSVPPASAQCVQKRVVMYSAPGCVWCDKARNIARANGFSLPERSAQRAGYRAWPVFHIEGFNRPVEGYNRPALNAAFCTNKFI